MKIQFVNNHVMVPVDTDRGIKYLILDTGLPGYSFLQDPGIRFISLGDKSFAITPSPPFFRNTIDWNIAAQLAGTRVDGFLGHDFFQSFDLIIDLNNNELSIDPATEGFTFINLDFMRNVPIVAMEIEGTGIKALFDTGAMYPVVTNELTSLLKDLHRSISDYNPFLGHFEARLLEGNLKLGSCLIEKCTFAASQAYDHSLAMLPGVRGILGMNAFVGRKIYISYRRRMLGVECAG